MDKLIQSFPVKSRNAFTSFSTAEWLGIWIGIIMPIVSAIVYPTYMHKMQTPWIEWSRLLEVPFVFCEVSIILWASSKGMNSTKTWCSMPADIKIALVMLTIGVFASSLFISAQPLQSVTISIFTMVHILFAVAVHHLMRKSQPADSRPLLFLLGAGLISLAILTLLKFAFPPPVTMVPGGVIEWVSALPGFISVRHFGSWTGAITAGFLVILLSYRNIKRVSWWHFFYFLSAAMTVWSGTRAAVLAIAIVAAILILVRQQFPSWESIGIISMLTGAAMTVAWFLLPHNELNFYLFLTSDVDSAGQLTSGRLDLWAATFDRWQDSVLLGWGSGSLFWEVYVGWTHTQPHNAILQFLFTWGIVGTLPALWLLGRATAKAHIVAIHNEAAQPFLAMLYALLLMSLLEGMLHYPRFIMLIMISFSVILACSDKKGDDRLAPSWG